MSDDSNNADYEEQINDEINALSNIEVSKVDHNI